MRPILDSMTQDWVMIEKRKIAVDEADLGFDDPRLIAVIKNKACGVPILVDDIKNDLISLASPWLASRPDAVEAA